MTSGPLHPDRELIIGVTPGARPDGRLVVARAGRGRSACSTPAATRSVPAPRWTSSWRATTARSASGSQPTPGSHQATSPMPSTRSWSRTPASWARTGPPAVACWSRSPRSTRPGPRSPPAPTGSWPRGPRAAAGSARSAFVLLQQLVGAIDAPVWVQGGIGLAHRGRRRRRRRRRRGRRRPAGAGCARRDPAAARSAGHRRHGRQRDRRGRRPPRLHPPRPVGRPMPATTPDRGRRPPRRRDLRTDSSLPVGQDGAFAARSPSRYGTAAASSAPCARRSPTTSPRPARGGRWPRARGAAATRARRYPVVQGPMTRGQRPRRVRRGRRRRRRRCRSSPSPLHARRPRSAPLLEETAAAARRPARGASASSASCPPELREEQLAVVRDVRPPVALIAGGRPSQAAPLEATGIRTFLHVPVARPARPVPQGRRPAVRVRGPRVRRPRRPAVELRPVGAPDRAARWPSTSGPTELDVLFAGGIHDERSAAMVAALAAPLAAGGARSAC